MAHPSGSVRCFTALALNAADRQWLQERLPPAWPEALRPVPLENWHLTLHFHGALEPRALQQLLARLEALPALPVVSAAASHWLDLPRHRPSVRALALKDHRDALKTLREILPAAGQAAYEKHRFLPHVSVGRYRRGNRQAAPVWPGPNEARVFQFQQLVLYQSLTGAQGVRYVPLWSLSLAL